jgi:hypothetical protein
VVLFFPCDDTFRKSAQKINRMWWREEKQDQVQSRTIANLVEREGEQIQASIEEKAERILEDCGFTSDGTIKDQQKVSQLIKEEEVLLDQEKICRAIEELNSGKEKEKQINLLYLRDTFEDPQTIKTNISVDDVCCKKQKAQGRKKGSPPKEKREMVYNTVTHVQNGNAQTYTLNTPTIVQMMIIMLAFLLHNELMSQPGLVVFFTDGARDLRSAILDRFRFLSFKIILDWYHLEKKCKDLLSMAISGKTAKELLLRELLAWLWLGKVDQAVKLLRTVNADLVRNSKELENLITYFDRHRDSIPCYALRERLGLRISSNPVEKANDLLVSNRQKHNGMSWSADGSTSLATLTSVRHNSEARNWLLGHNILLQFDPAAQKPAA